MEENLKKLYEHLNSYKELDWGTPEDFYTNMSSNSNLLKVKGYLDSKGDLDWGDDKSFLDNFGSSEEITEDDEKRYNKVVDVLSKNKELTPEDTQLINNAYNDLSNKFDNWQVYNKKEELPPEDVSVFKRQRQAVDGMSSRLLANLLRSPRALYDLIASVDPAREVAMESVIGAFEESLRKKGVLNEEQIAEARNNFAEDILNESSGARSFMSAMADNDFTESLDKRSEEMEAKSNIGIEDTLTNYLKRGEYGKAYEKIAVEGARSLPFMGMALAGGYGIAAIGVEEMAGRMEELREEDGFIDSMNAINASIYGVAEAVPEMVTGGLLRGTIKSLSGKALKEQIKKGVKQGFGRTLASGGLRVGKGFAEEGLSETATTLAQAFGDAATGQEAWDSDRVFEDAIESFLIGGFIGAGITAPGAAGNAIRGEKTGGIIEDIINRDEKGFQETVDKYLESGILTEKQAAIMKTKYQEFQEIDGQIPPDISDKKRRQEIYQVLKKKLVIDKELDGLRAEEVAPTFQERRQKRIDNLQEKSDELKVEIEKKAGEEPEETGASGSIATSTESGASETGGEGEAPPTFTEKDQEFKEKLFGEKAEKTPYQTFKETGEVPTETIDGIAKKELNGDTLSMEEREIKANKITEVNARKEALSKEGFEKTAYKQTEFDKSTNRKEAVGKQVSYGGIEGTVVETETGFGVETADGQVVEIESGASNQSNLEVGLRELPGQTPLEETAEPLDPKTIAYNQDTNTIQAYGKTFEVVKPKYDQNGNISAVVAKTKDGEVRTIRNKDILKLLPKGTQTAAVEGLVEADTKDGFTPIEQAEFEVDVLKEEMDTLEGELSEEAELIAQEMRDNPAFQDQENSFTEPFDEGTGRDQGLSGPLAKRRNASVIAKAVLDGTIPKAIRDILGDKYINELKEKAKRWRELAGRTTPTSIRNKVAEGVAEQRKTKVAELMERLYPGITERKKTLKEAVRLLAKSLPNISVIVYDTPADFVKATEGALSFNTRGAYDTDTGIIHINAAYGGVGTLYHEAAHAVFQKLFKTGSKDAKLLHEAVYNVLIRGNAKEKALARYLRKFTDSYDLTDLTEKDKREGTDLADLRAEEFFAELVSFLTNNKEKISKPRKQSIIEAIDKIIKSFTGLSIFSKERTTINELIDLINSIAGGLGKGYNMDVLLEDRMGALIHKPFPVVKGNNPNLKSRKQRISDASEKLQNLFRRDNIPLTREEAIEIVNETMDWVDWYDDISRYAGEVFGEYAEDFLSLLPLSSINNGSAGTVSMSINNIERIYKGERPEGIAANKGQVDQFLQGGGIDSLKPAAFIKAIFGDLDAVAVDSHVWSILKSSKKKISPTKPEHHERATKFVKTIAEATGVPPRGVQAALWAANMMRLGTKPNSYEEYIEKHIQGKNDSYTRKTWPGLKERIQSWRDQGYKPFSELRKKREQERGVSSYRKQRPKMSTEGRYADVPRVDLFEVLEQFRRENKNRNPNIWFWAGDWLNRGEYYNPVTGVRHFLEGGMGYPLDPNNLEKGIIWASSTHGTQQDNFIEKADFIFMSQMSPDWSMDFSKNTLEVWIKEGMAINGLTSQQLFNKIKKAVHDNFDKSGDALQTIKDKLAEAKLSGKKLSLSYKEQAILTYGTHNNFEEILDDTHTAEDGVLGNANLRKGALSILHKGETKISTVFHTYLHKELGMPNRKEHTARLHDPFLVENNFQWGDISLILKPKGFIDKGGHSTYKFDMTGEVVGIPDRLVNIFDIAPEEYHYLSSGALSTAAQKVKKVTPDGGTVILDYSVREEPKGVTLLKMFESLKPIDKEADLVEVLQGKFTALTSQNPNGKKVSKEENDRLYVEGKQWLEENGYEYLESVGVFDGNEEMSFIVPNMTEVDALNFMTRFSQKEIVTDEYAYNNKGEYAPIIGKTTYEQRPYHKGDNYKSYVKREKTIVYTITANYDFDSKTTEPSFRKRKVADDAIPYLTEDGQGNYVFYHYSAEPRSVIDPKKFGGNTITSRTEQGDLSGAESSFYYTVPGFAENGVGPVQHQVKIPIEKVYDATKDPDDFYDEARRRFKKERGENMAFPPNAQIAWVSKVAMENGYEMAVARWTEIPGNGNFLRAQTTLAHKPEPVNGEYKSDYKSKANPVSNSVDKVELPRQRALDRVNEYINNNDFEPQVGSDLHSVLSFPENYTEQELDNTIDDSDLPQFIKDEYKEKVKTTMSLRKQKPGREDVLNRLKESMDELLDAYETTDNIFDKFREHFEKFGVSLDDINMIFYEGNTVETPKSVTEKAEAIMVEAMEVMRKAGFTQEQIDANLTVFSEVAARWAKQNGKTISDWWVDKIDSFKFAADAAEIPGTNTVFQAQFVKNSIWDKIRKLLGFNEAKKHQDPDFQSTPLQEDIDLNKTDEGRQFSEENRPVIRGARHLLDNGKAVIYLTKDATVSTPVHELVHVYEMYMPKADRAEFLKQVGRDTWTPEVSELFAVGFEAYLKNGRESVNNKLQEVFDNFKTWLRDIYSTVLNVNGKPVVLNAKMNEIYSRMFLSEVTNDDKYEQYIEETEKKVREDELKMNSATFDEMADVMGFEKVSVYQRGTLAERAKEAITKGYTDVLHARDRAAELLAQARNNGPNTVILDPIEHFGMKFALYKLMQQETEVREQMADPKTGKDNPDLYDAYIQLVGTIQEVSTVLSLTSSTAAALLGGNGHKFKMEFFDAEALIKRSETVRDKPLSSKQKDAIRYAAREFKRAEQTLKNYELRQQEALANKKAEQAQRSFKKLFEIPAFKHILDKLKEDPRPIDEVENELLGMLKDYYKTSFSWDFNGGIYSTLSALMAVVQSTDRKYTRPDGTIRRVDSIEDFVEYVNGRLKSGPLLTSQDVYDILYKTVSYPKAKAFTKKLYSDKEQMEKEMRLYETVRNFLNGTLPPSTPTKKYNTRSDAHVILQDMIKEMKDLALNDTNGSSFFLLDMYLDQIESMHESLILDGGLTLSDSIPESVKKAMLTNLESYQRARVASVEDRAQTFREKIASVDRTINHLNTLFNQGKTAATKVERDAALKAYEGILSRLAAINDPTEVIDDNEYYRAKAEYDRKKAILMEKANETLESDYNRYIREALNTPRALILSFDYSFIPYQAGFYTMRELFSPRAPKAFSNIVSAIRSSMSEVFFSKEYEDFKNHFGGKYYEALNMGLQLPERGEGQPEETLRTKSILERLLPSETSQYSKFNFLRGIRNFNERGYVNYMSRIRLQEYARLTRGVTDVKLKQEIAERINTFSGASQRFSKDERKNKQINKAIDASADLLIAPRLYMSVFKSLAKLTQVKGIMDYVNEKNPQRKEYLRKAYRDNLHILGAQAGAFLLFSALAYAIGGDDEESFLDSMKLDPRKSGFMKTRFGSTVLTLNPFASYIRAGSKVTMKTAEQVFRIETGLSGRDKQKNVMEVAWAEFFQYRLNPVVTSSRALASNRDWRGELIPFEWKYQLVDRYLASVAPISVTGVARNIAFPRGILPLISEAALDMAGFNSYTVEPGKSDKVQAHYNSVKYTHRLQYPEEFKDSEVKKATFKRRVNEEFGAQVKNMLDEGRKPSKKYLNKLKKRVQRKIEREMKKE